jgi:hypothetical protein
MKRVLFIFLLLALSACSIQPTLPASTSTTAASLPVSAPPAPSLAPSATPLPTQTSIPVPAYPPPPTPASAEATPTTVPTLQFPELTGPIDGPWLISQSSSQIEPGVTLAVSDLAGKNRYRIELPALNTEVVSHWQIILPPRGNFVAAQWMSSEIVSGAPSYEIWLFTLNEGRLVRKIQQFSDAALEEIRKIPPLLPHQRFSIEPPILSAINGQLQWSPDGRYLVFSAAFEGTDVNLYLYDTQTDRIRQISFEVHQARFRSWSPDGRYIIYNQEVADDTYTDLGSWLVDLQNSETRYLSHLRVKDWSQWISSESLLASECADEAPCFNLRRLDIPSGQEKMLFSNPYNQFAAEPIFGVIFLMKGWPSGWPPGETGIYRLFEDGSLEKLTSEKFDYLQWNIALSMFIGTSPAELDVVAFDRYGAEKLRFPAAGTISVSPDGKWIGAAGNLYRADGTFVAHIGAAGPELFWAPDSGSFFRATDGGDLFIYRMSDGWQGELFASHPQFGLLGIVQPATN